MKVFQQAWPPFLSFGLAFLAVSSLRSGFGRGLSAGNSDGQRSSGKPFTHAADAPPAGKGKAPAEAGPSPWPEEGLSGDALLEVLLDGDARQRLLSDEEALLKADPWILVAFFTHTRGWDWRRLEAEVPGRMKPAVREHRRRR